MTVENNVEPIQQVQHLSATDRRDAMWAQGVRLLALLNGGASVALLAFLQGIWVKAPELIFWITLALVIFAVGLAFACAIPLIREGTVLYWNTKWRNWYFWSYRLSACVSLMLFLVGTGTIALGVFNNLPCDTIQQVQ